MVASPIIFRILNVAFRFFLQFLLVSFAFFSFLLSAALNFKKHIQYPVSAVIKSWQTDVKMGVGSLHYQLQENQKLNRGNRQTHGDSVGSSPLQSELSNWTRRQWDQLNVILLRTKVRKDYISSYCKHLGTIARIVDNMEVLNKLTPTGYISCNSLVWWNVLG